MINPINKKGYSFIGLILGVVILSVISISSIYSVNTGNLDEVTTGVVSKLEYTQEFAKVRDATTVVDVPHIELAKKKMNSIVEQNGVNYQYKDTPYINNLTNNIEVTTNLNNNTLYFSSQGYPIDENGKLLEDVRIYVTKKVLGVETKVYTITIDCTGNIEIIKLKDTSSKRTCSLADREEALENIKVCDEGQELYNGSCVESCNYDQKRVNGVCEDICPSGQVYSSDGSCKNLCNPTFIVNPTTKQCECPSGYEPFNGVCVEKCKANETRNSTGTCQCVSGFERVNGVCLAKCNDTEIRDVSGVCKATEPNLIYKWSGDLSCTSDEMPANGVYGSGLFNNTWRIIKIPYDGTLVLKANINGYKLKSGQSIRFSARDEGWSWDRSKADSVFLLAGPLKVKQGEVYLGIYANFYDAELFRAK